MARFRLSEPVHIETHHGTHGPIDLSFPAGDVSPRSEQEEAALLHLVGIGLAERIGETPAPASTPEAPVPEPEAVTDAPQ